MRNKTLLGVCLSIFLCSVSLQKTFAEECLVIASDPNSAKVISLFTPGVQMVFEKAKVCTRYVNMPISRIQKEMTESSVDGEFLRVKAYIHAMNDHVVAVPTPVVEAKGILVTMKTGGFTPKTILDVEDKVIGHVFGVRWHDALAKKLKNPRSSKKYDNLAKQLVNKRIDGFLVEELTLKRLIKAGLLKEEQIHKSEPVMDLSAYIVLHKKNRNFVKDLDVALKQVKAEGGFGKP